MPAKSAAQQKLLARPYPTRTQLVGALKSKVLAKGSLVGIYERI